MEGNRGIAGKGKQEGSRAVAGEGRRAGRRMAVGDGERRETQGTVCWSGSLAASRPQHSGCQPAAGPPSAPPQTLG